MNRLNRVLWLAAAAGLLGVPALAQDHGGNPTIAGGGKFPPGWALRSDRGRPLTNVKFEKMGPGNDWHFTMGNVAAIAYRDADKATGSYHAVAKFTQMKAPGMGHGEGMGIFIGGSDLQGPGQAYTYFLVRQDGMFIIKRRTGESTTTIADWTAHAAVTKADSAGKAENEVAVGVKDGKASFTVNGKEVYSADASRIDANGVVGLRVNHGLDVHVAGFAIHKL